MEEYAALKTELTSEINSLKGRNEAAQQVLDSLRSAYEAAQQEINTLKSGYEAAQQEIDSLKNSNAAAQREINSLGSSHAAAQQKIDILKVAIAAAQREIDALKAADAASREEIDTLEAANQAAQQEIERLKKQIQELQDQIAPTKKIRIYIDQGHNPTGYHNAGASGNGLYEQDLTFTIGRLLAQLLEQDGRFEVCLSRPTADTVLGTDNTSSLEARVRGAQEFGAEYFISLHTNSFSSESANGIEVYAAEQNSTSYAFGNQLLQGLVRATNLRNRGMKLDPDLHVLKNATMPAVLLEMGFISNREDAALLAQSPELFAKGMYDGILAYFGLPARDIFEY
ncbi:MAG: hypothetical protein E7625_03215 [Ruminococcaceae bacterium]|nr:hypothetical protein [Oscillospiraceae bacterium]